ncbi:MAG TPA: DUF6398 domain-containing protein [Sedimentisphaerales bacterium]|nr:DUF6398 domain-containing protein [Sedimentisphaerales bacterium]
MGKRKKTEQNKGRSKRASKDFRDEYQRIFTEILKLTDAFCETYLNEDYRKLCEEMAMVICLGELPSEKGRPAGWASGIVHAVGWVNFLHDPGQSPYMTSAEVAEGFGVSQGTTMAKSRIIRDELGLMPLDPDWCIPAMLKDNPLVWMLEVNGFIMDIRIAPREVQEEAYRQGLIPFIPADEQEPEPKPKTGPKIIEFPSKRNETSRLKSPQKLKDDGPNLFERLEKQGISDVE